MSTRTKELVDLGLVGTENGNSVGQGDWNTLGSFNDLDFTGYGAFTPITVGSSTVISHAHLERDKLRD